MLKLIIIILLLPLLPALAKENNPLIGKWVTDVDAIRKYSLSQVTLNEEQRKRFEDILKEKTYITFTANKVTVEIDGTKSTYDYKLIKQDLEKIIIEICVETICEKHTNYLYEEGFYQKANTKLFGRTYFTRSN